MKLRKQLDRRRFSSDKNDRIYNEKIKLLESGDVDALVIFSSMFVMIKNDDLNRNELFRMRLCTFETRHIDKRMNRSLFCQITSDEITFYRRTEMKMNSSLLFLDDKSSIRTTLDPFELFEPIEKFDTRPPGLRESVFFI